MSQPPRKPTPCDICGNVGAVVLPSREGPMKNFPCPQCSPLTNITAVMTLSASIMLNRQYMAERAYRDHVKKSLSESLLDAMVRAGHIMFKERKPDKNGDVLFNGYVALVAPHVAPKLEARIAERQREVADASAKRAISKLLALSQIQDILGVQIYIGTAVDIIKDAVEEELKAREETDLDAPKPDTAQQ